jgi:hypothetical protein
MRRAGVALVSTALLCLGATPAAAQEVVPSDEARVHALVNATRAQRGLLPLERVDALVGLAREQSSRMEREGKIFHNLGLKDALNGLGLDWHWSGENVGVGPDVLTIQNAFLGSTHHLENIVRSNYNALGVGVIADGDGYFYVTQVFAELTGIRPNLPDPPTPVPAPVATPRPAPRRPDPTPVPATPSPTPKPPDPVVVEGGITTGGPVPATPRHSDRPLVAEIVALLQDLIPSGPPRT